MSTIGRLVLPAIRTSIPKTANKIAPKNTRALSQGTNRIASKPKQSGHPTEKILKESPSHFKNLKPLNIPTSIGDTGKRDVFQLPAPGETLSIKALAAKGFFQDSLSRFNDLCETYGIKIAPSTKTYFNTHPAAVQWNDALKALSTKENFQVLQSVKNPHLTLQRTPALDESLKGKGYSLYLYFGEKPNRRRIKLLWPAQPFEQPATIQNRIHAVMNAIKKYNLQNPQGHKPAIPEKIALQTQTDNTLEAVRRYTIASQFLDNAKQYRNTVSQQAARYLLHHSQHYQATLKILGEVGGYAMRTIHEAKAHICLLREGTLALVRQGDRSWHIPTDHEALNNHQAQTLSQSISRATSRINKKVDQLHKDNIWRDYGVKHDAHGDITCIREPDGSITGTPFGMAWIK